MARGNAVLKAKRVHGPSANTIMHTRIAVAQLEGRYPAVVSRRGTPVGERSDAIVQRIKAKVALKGLPPLREY